MRSLQGQPAARISFEVMVSRLLRSWVTWVLLAAAAGAAIYSTWSAGRYEYEEVLDLELDGSATLDVTASIAALVAVHGADLDPGAAATPDPARVRALLAAPGVEVSAVTFFRRGGRRFVHVSLDVADVRRLTASAPFASSAFRLDRQGEVLVYRQVVRTAGANEPGASGAWTGRELAAVKVHVPSRVLYENATSNVQRGNILVWEQPLAARLAGEPVELHVEMETSSILATTLTLFAATVGAVAIVFAVIIGLVVRKGRAAQASAASLPP